MNRIQKHYDFVKSPQFQEASVKSLEMRRKMLTEAHKSYEEQHNKLLTQLPRYRFADIDGMRAMVDDQYIQTAVAIDDKLDRLRDINRKVEEKIEIEKKSANYNMCKDFKDRATIEDDEATYNESVYVTGEETGTRKNNVRIPDSDESESDNEIKHENRNFGERPAVVQQIEVNQRPNVKSRIGTTVQSRVVRANVKDRVGNVQTNRADVRERLGRYRTNERRFNQDGNRFKRETTQVARIAPSARETNENVQNSANKSKKSISCYYCYKNHTLKDCEQFLRLPVESRWSAVSQMNLCRNCFIPLHLVPEPHRCRFNNCGCGGFHNTTLCRTKVINNRASFQRN